MHRLAICFLIVMSGWLSSLASDVKLENDSLQSIYDKALQGDENMQIAVGYWYFNGENVPRDYTRALKWWAMSAAQGNSIATANMALCYRNGFGTDPDSLKASGLYLNVIKRGNASAFMTLEQEANDGNPFSCMVVAECYERGLGVKRNMSEAISLWQKVAEKGSGEAQAKLALALLNMKDSENAFHWFQQASHNGNAMSTFYCGRMLLEGKGITPDTIKGIDYILKAVQREFPQSYYYLGNCYMHGTGVQVDTLRAFELYRHAASIGVHGAQWALATCHRKGIGTKPNFHKALYWYGESAAQGHKKGFAKLVNDSIPDSPFVTYLKGLKLLNQGNLDQAVPLFRQVAFQGYKEGDLLWATIYLNPAYKGHDLTQGELKLRFATHEIPEATYLLGLLYESGIGVPLNPDIANNLIHAAAIEGCAEAMCRLGDECFANQDYKCAVDWYRRAMTEGPLTDDATENLAYCYENGVGGLAPDKKSAEKIRKTYHPGRIAALLNLVN